ncbi:MAG: hypothetical protein H0X30_06740 [Anaerolineae bacterium]|nr:hypothetical protein [Anaerolineae bacterium]
MEMADDVARYLNFPAKAELPDYLDKTFAAEQVVKAIDDEQFVAVEQPQPLTDGIWGEAIVGDSLLVHIAHDSHHLGMKECL